MNSFLDDLSEEQRTQVLLGGVGLAVLILVYLLWSLSSSVTEKTSKLQTAQQRMQDFAQMAAEIKAAKGTGAASGSKRRGASLNSSVNDSAKRAGLTLTRVNTANDEKTAQIYLDSAPFDKVVTWLEDLQKGYNVQVDNINITAVRDEPGVVKVNLKVEDLEAN